MDKGEALKKVNEIFIDVLDNPDIVLTDLTTANDVEDWDSLNHIQIIVGIEKKLKIRFTSIEIQSWKNVGEMINCILTKSV
jgi:acyl carrier protein